MRLRPLLLLSIVAVPGCASPPSEGSAVSPPAPEASAATYVSTAPFGVLVMAHGGTQEWNDQVADAVAPLAAEFPTRLAYGMADPGTLRAALDSLRADGVSRVAVVRMFLSGRSFLDQTEFLLGLSDTPPGEWILMTHGATHASGHTGDPNPPAPLRHGLTVATHGHGMLESPEARRIMRARARELASSPSSESVLFLAHGMGDEAENEEVLGSVRAIAGVVESDGFARAEAATLREDWADERVVAEREIREFVSGETARGRRVLVVPMRLSGFGPYAEVLQGLSYVPGEGLVPHPEVAAWLRSTASRIACAQGWLEGGRACGTVTEDFPGGGRSLP